jgi:AraC-like DNA-binding protein
MKTYLAKAITENNGYRRFNAYRYLAYYARKKEVKFNFYEKALKERGSLDDPNKIYLYIQIGIAHYDYYEYEAAMNYYLKGLKLAQKNNDKWSKNSEYMLFNNIANIKGDLGKHDEALALYKKNSAYEILKKDTLGNLVTKMNIAESMRYNKKYDSASYYYHSVIDKIAEQLPSRTSRVRINEGINIFYKKNYRESEKLLRKEFSQVDFNNIELQKYYILTSLYLGKIQQTYYHETEKAKTYFIKVDSLVSKVKAIIPETIEAYEFLINYYDENGNVEKQLDAVTKLYQLRTTMSSRKINTVNILHSEFDTPELLKNKELLIQKLEGKTNKLNTRVLYLIAFGFLFFLLFILQYFKRRQYKKRFNAIILELDSQKTKRVSHNNLSITPQLASIIDEATVTAIAKKLDSFEAEKGFLQNDLNVAMVAKKCDTNAKYLSKIIHTYKEKSFVNYINNLRIDYILKELKENTILQKYTIKSISEEAGFNTAESFATAFKKRAGIRPSYYIRNLKSK